MIRVGCGKWDSGADKRAWRSEEEMQLSMTLLLPLTTTHRSPFSDFWSGPETSNSVPSQELAFLSFPVCTRAVACLNYALVPPEFPPHIAALSPAVFLPLHVCAGSSCPPTPHPFRLERWQRLNGENKNLTISTFMPPRDGTDKMTTTQVLFLKLSERFRAIRQFWTAC